MKLEISKYNAQLSLLKEHVSLHLKAISFDQAKDPNSGLYQQYADSQPSTRDKVPFALKRRIIELSDLE